MTPDDERLAPVTSLLGRRAADESGEGGSGGRPSGQRASRARSSTAGSAPEVRPASRVEREDEWPTAADVTAGDDETAGSDTAAHGKAHPAGRGQGGTGHPKLVALPTYAAFAAASEPEGSGTRRPVAMAAGDANAEPQPEWEPDEPPEPAQPPEPPAESLEAARDRAENISMHALSRRGVSSVEMAKTLRSRDLPEDVVLDEIERLERVGLLDDVALAENLVLSKQARKGLGKSAINAELRQRGLAQEAIDAALGEVDDDEEQTRADDWALKRAGQLRGLDQATAERRLSAFLMRRGYRSEVVRRAIEKALPRGGGSGRVHFK